jgi:tRNA pseudouridine55 synthase
MVTLDIRCGKGVYIRSLARDLGLMLGTGGTLAWLRRTRVGAWSIRDAVRPERLPDPLDGAAFGAIAAEVFREADSDGG